LEKIIELDAANQFVLRFLIHFPLLDLLKLRFNGPLKLRFNWSENHLTLKLPCGSSVEDRKR
jgi:hypothetical protein